MNITDKIIEYECEGLNDTETLKLFAELIKNGMAWSLQGSYGRTASYLIEQGLINVKGEILV